MRHLLGRGSLPRWSTLSSWFLQIWFLGFWIPVGRRGRNRRLHERVAIPCRQFDPSSIWTGTRCPSHTWMQILSANGKLGASNGFCGASGRYVCHFWILGLGSRRRAFVSPGPTFSISWSIQMWSSQYPDLPLLHLHRLYCPWHHIAEYSYLLPKSNESVEYLVFLILADSFLDSSRSTTSPRWRGSSD